MIAKLKKEAEEDATEKAYCDEEMKKTEDKKAELEEDLAKVTVKLEQSAANSAKLKDVDVKTAQKQLAALAKEQAEMDAIRGQEHGHYVKATNDLKACPHPAYLIGKFLDAATGARLHLTSSSLPSLPQ